MTILGYSGSRCLHDGRVDPYRINAYLYLNIQTTSWVSDFSCWHQQILSPQLLVCSCYCSRSASYLVLTFQVGFSCSCCPLCYCKLNTLRTCAAVPIQKSEAYLFSECQHLLLDWSIVQHLPTFQFACSLVRSSTGQETSIDLWSCFAVLSMRTSLHRTCPDSIVQPMHFYGISTEASRFLSVCFRGHLAWGLWILLRLQSIMAIVHAPIEEHDSKVPRKCLLWRIV